MTDSAENAQTASAMNVLGIDTSTALAGIALQFDGVRRSETWRSDHNHGVELMPRILAMMSDVGCRLIDLDRIAVALGPGGFSAVRVGVSCAQGLAAPLSGSVQPIGVPTHYLQARCWELGSSSKQLNPSGNFVNSELDPDGSGDVATGGNATSVIPIGRDQVSWAEFRLPLGGIDTGDRTGIWSRAEMAAATAAGRSLCGEGLSAIEDRHRSDPEVSSRRPPAMLLDIANEVPSTDNDMPDGASKVPLRPLYAREPTITRRK